MQSGPKVPAHPVSVAPLTSSVLGPNRTGMQRNRNTGSPDGRPTREEHESATNELESGLERQFVHTPERCGCSFVSSPLKTPVGMHRVTVLQGQHEKQLPTEAPLSYRALSS